jgi:sulfur-oxidizing protein SoxY
VVVRPGSLVHGTLARSLSRRGVLALGAYSLAVEARAGLPGDAPAMMAALTRFAAGGALREGRVQLELPELVENGNAVPVTLAVPGPLAAGEEVAALALFAARNPSPEAAVFTWPARPGPVRVATRMRLATSQAVVAAARMTDGTVWTRRVDVLVTLAACVEG